MPFLGTTNRGTSATAVAFFPPSTAKLGTGHRQSYDPIQQRRSTKKELPSTSSRSLSYSFVGINLPGYRLRRQNKQLGKQHSDASSLVLQTRASQAVPGKQWQRVIGTGSADDARLCCSAASRTTACGENTTKNTSFFGSVAVGGEAALLSC